jgi:hypothetical protein
MAEDPRGFRSDVHAELADLVTMYKLPLKPEDAEWKIRTAAILDGIMMRALERDAVGKAS